MIVLRSPKGWTGAEVVDGLQIEGSFRAHQVPLMLHKSPRLFTCRWDSATPAPEP